MNSIKLRIPFFNIYTFLTILVAIVVIQSCNVTKYNFLTSSVVPAAEGAVNVNKDKNGNYSIHLDVKRLADPTRLNPSKAMYVVWMETEQNGIKNIGQLKTSSGLFSDNLNSSITTATPFKPRSFFITAEDSESIQYPDGQVILKTESMQFTD